jgi:hypothetical protein
MNLGARSLRAVVAQIKNETSSIMISPCPQCPFYLSQRSRILPWYASDGFVDNEVIEFLEQDLLMGVDAPSACAKVMIPSYSEFLMT